MSGPGKHAGPDPLAQAEALAKELNGASLTATVLRNHGHRFHPCVLIVAGQGRGAADCVYAAPDYDAGDGQWWFWWSWLEPIAPVSEVITTAEEIADAFTRACGILSAEATPA